MWRHKTGTETQDSGRCSQDRRGLLGQLGLVAVQDSGGGSHGGGLTFTGPSGMFHGAMGGAGPAGAEEGAQSVLAGGAWPAVMVPLCTLVIVCGRVPEYEHVSVCACMHLCVYVCIFFPVCMCACLSARRPVCVSVCVCTGTQMPVCQYVYFCSGQMPVCVSLCICVHVCTGAPRPVYLCVYVHMVYVYGAQEITHC